MAPVGEPPAGGAGGVGWSFERIDKETLQMRDLLRSRPARRLLLALLLLAAAAVVGGGTLLQRQVVGEVRAAREADLAAIGQLKAERVANWRNRQLAEVRLHALDPLMAAAVAHWLAHPQGGGVEAQIRQKLAQARDTYQWRTIVLASPDGRALLALDEGADNLGAPAQQLIEQVAASGAAALGPIYRSPVTGKLRLDIAAPIVDPQQRVAAVLLARSLPERELFPLVQYWPTPSRTAETLLVRRDGDHVQFLNRLRHDDAPPLSLRRPLADTGTVAVMAARGQTGIAEGRDYRGVEVLADLRPVPASDWFIVAKVDADEILAEVHYRSRVIAGFAGGGIALAALLFAMLTGMQRQQSLRRLYAVERGRREALEEFRATLRSIGDAVISTDAHGRVRQMNAVAEALTGWREPEAQGRALAEVFRIVNEHTRASVESPVAQVLRDGRVVGLANHTLLIARDGSERPIADSGAPVRDDQGHTIGVVLVFRDQSAERDAQAALAASEAQLRLVLETIPECVQRVAPEGQLLDINAAGLRMFEATARAQLLGRPVADAVHPADRAAYADLHRRTLAGEAATQLLRITGLQGSERWVETHSAPLREAGGAVTAVLCATRDVSELRHRQQTAALEARLLEAVSMATPLPAVLREVCLGIEAMYPGALASVLLVDGEGRLAHGAAPSLPPGYTRQIDGVQPGPAAGSCGTAVHRREPVVVADIAADPLWRDYAATALAHGLRACWSVPVLDRTGAAVATFAVYHREPRHPGAEQLEAIARAARIVGIAITRHRHDEALRKFALAVEQSPESIVITDLQARIEYVNDAFVRISGYPRDELLGRNPRLLQSGRTPPETYRSLWAALSAGRQWSGEFFNRRKDGSEFVEAAVISPLRQSDGQITHYVAIKEDITEKRRIAAELDGHRHHLEALVAARTAEVEEARTQAEAANLAKSAFLANMSHEIRTPMNGVLGMLEVLAHGRLSEQQAELVRTAQESGRTLLGIIDDILDFSKIEAGRLEIERTPTSVADLVEGLCDALVALATRREVDLSVYVAPEIPAHVGADPLRVRQVLFNLIGNAIKFSAGRAGRRGRVAVRVTPVPGTPLRLAFAVADNGIGMAPEVVERLFVPFSQAEVSTTRRYGGTGLGLTICKRLAELMHGEIAVASRPGEGSVFTLTLPVDVPAEQPQRILPDLTGIDCVVVAAEELDVDGIVGYLDAAGARVRRAADDREAARVLAPLAGGAIVVRSAGAHPNPADDPLVGCGPQLRQVWITRGRRRRARVESPTLVTLDGAALRRQALLRAVAVVAGRASPEVAHGETALPVGGATTPPTVAEARARGELILVAEDDEINAKVLRSQLELLGRTAEYARDGAQALRLWLAGGHALLLTDLHMPLMDGYELTAAIRAHEAAGAPRARRLPIVALTANALRGEAERARAAGIDDYLTKPLQLELLRQTIDHWLAAAGTPSTTDDPTPTPAAATVLDLGVLAAQVGDDPATQRELLALFLTHAARQAAALRTAGDAAAAAALAHQLKSSARAVGALALGELCAAIEAAAQAGEFAAVAPSIPAFDTAFARVEAEITRRLQAAGA
jgi:PAS domain S-box-containing protein